jgi:transcriptional regulator with XRE-family HTH domain
MSKIKTSVLKELRKQHGKTQSDVAHDLSIGRTSYTRIENGVYDVDTTLLMRLAEYYHVSINHLLGVENKGDIVAQEIQDIYLRADEETRLKLLSYARFLDGER